MTAHTTISSEHRVYVVDRQPFTVDVDVLTECLVNAGLQAVPVDWRDLIFSSDGIAIEGEDLQPRTDATVILTSRVTSRDPDRQHLFLFNEVLSLGLSGRRVLNGNYENRDKWLQALRFQSAGVPTPRTWIVRNSRDVARRFQESGPVIVKPRIGRGGLGQVSVLPTVARFTRDGDLSGRTDSHLWESFKNYGSLICQELVQNPIRELRIVVVDGQPVLSMEHAGEGQAPAMRETSCEVAGHVACTAVQALGWDYGEVDVIESDDGFTVIEVNPTLNGDVYRNHSDAEEPLAGYKSLAEMVRNESAGG